MCLRSNETDSVETFICHLMKNLYCPFQNDSFEKLYTVPFLETVLKFFYRNYFLLIDYNLLDAVHSSKMIFLKITFEYWENERVTWIHIWGVRRLWKHMNTFVWHKTHLQTRSKLIETRSWCSVRRCSIRCCSIFVTRR